MGMFCFQCEQAARGTGCTMVGVCGKDPQRQLSLFSSPHRAATLFSSDKKS